ncbi:hypothetical protein HPB47_004833 [Ixodes persulcatus]|uniref:Uncharacterized protein n=1 Tax=Ixodes persulcatus TaxID=34615 RepID=A0AC60PEP8_IXOPE|nr:hypothetical protein HPB47_004833 [Ixodes persulcatus]
MCGLFTDRLRFLVRKERFFVRASPSRSSMTKAYDFNWQRTIPEALLKGCIFDRWEEDGQVLELSQVNDIRAGGIPKDVRLLAELSSKNRYGLDEVSLTICSGTDMVNINYTHVVCPDPDTAKVWQAGLRSITNNIKANNVCPATCLEKHWIKLGFLVEPEGKLPVRRIAQTFASGKTEKLVYQCIADVGLPGGKNDVIEPKEFTLEKFQELYQRVCPRNDIEELFNTITEGKTDYITLKQFISFLNEKQRDPRLNEILHPFYDERRVREIVGAYETSPELVKEGRLSQGGLVRYLMSDENAPVFLDRLDMYMDMDQPLSHYYINSSHNTYLTGRQFGGKSSVEIHACVCRCVELDCWDGKGEDEEPIITHGKAMCTDILFKLEPCVSLPTPNELKRKILIKNKRLKPEDEKRELELWKKGQLQNDDDEEEKEDASVTILAPTEEGEGEKKVSSPRDGRGWSTRYSTLTRSADGAVQVEAQLEEQLAMAHYQYTGATVHVHPFLSSLVNYAQPVKFQGFDVAEERSVHFNMSSFAETSALGYLKSQAIEFVKYP